jgi:hypothetical protein
MKSNITSEEFIVLNNLKPGENIGKIEDANQ